MTRMCPNGHEVNDNLKFCPKCGAEIKESGIRFCKKCGTERKGAEKFCSKCGTPFEGVLLKQPISQPIPSYDEAKAETDYKKIIIPIVIGLIVLALVGGGWYGYKEYSAYTEKKLAREKFVADSLEKVRQDSIKQAEALAKEKQDELERQEMIKGSLAFLERFYKKADKVDNLDEYVKQYLTDKAIQILKNEWPYDCDDGNCLASYVFFYEAGTDVEFIKRSFKSIDANTYEVINVMGYEGVPSSKYIVTLGIIKEGNFYKINDISYRSTN